MYLSTIKAVFTTATCVLALATGSAAVPAEPVARDIVKRASPPPTNQAFINNVLNTANAIRAKYQAPPLTWDPTLAAAALRKSNGCRLDHSGPYGENAYWWWTNPPTATPNFTTRVQSAFNAWCSTAEISAYLAGDLLGGGHFTQTVWKASRRIGCAFSTERCVRNPNQEWYFYCDFSPRGNVIGFYPGNVTVV